MLFIKDVSKHFGGLNVIDNLTLRIPEKTIFGLIGPNGAGKTTVFNLITGILKPSSGMIRFRDYELTTMAPHRITRAGIARTFQNIRIFPEMTLFENVMVGMHDQLSYGIWDTLFHLPGHWMNEKKAKERSHELLSWVSLDSKAGMSASSLSYGEQRKLELARALATDPELLLLDEPVAGMNPHETSDLMEEIVNIKERGYSIFLIDHDMKFVMGLCSEIAVLNFGSLIAQGSPEDIRNNRDVIEAYLGKEDDRG
jgi:branched-chain amino acid transport system ATP-binding protein